MGKGKNKSESKSDFFEFLHHLYQYLFIGCPIDFNFLVKCKRPNTKRYTSSLDTWAIHISFSVMLFTALFLFTYFYYSHLFVAPSSIPHFRCCCNWKNKYCKKKNENNFHHISLCGKEENLCGWWFPGRLVSHFLAKRSTQVLALLMHTIW